MEKKFFFFCEHRFYCFWSYWCLRVKYHMFLFFQKFFFTKSRKFLCDYVIFCPKYAIFYIHFTTKYPSFWAKIFWTQKSKENLRNSVLLMPCFVLEYYPPEVTRPVSADPTSFVLDYPPEVTRPISADPTSFVLDLPTWGYTTHFCRHYEFCTWVLPTWGYTAHWYFPSLYIQKIFVR